MTRERVRHKALSRGHALIKLTDTAACAPLGGCAVVLRPKQTLGDPRSTGTGQGTTAAKPRVCEQLHGLKMHAVISLYGWCTDTKRVERRRNFTVGLSSISNGGVFC